MDSISTPTPWGISSRRLSSAFSRMISAQITRSGWSVIMSSGKYLGPWGMAAHSRSSRVSRPFPVTAEVGTTWSKPNSLMDSSRGSSCSGPTRSTLFTARNRGQAMAAMSARMARSPSPMCWASTTASTASTPSRASVALFTMYWPSLVRGLCKPGVSTNTICQSARVATPKILVRVVWGRSDTMATFSPTKAFIRLDLPTLGRPTMATKPE